MYERILEADLARYERLLRDARDEGAARKLQLLLDATRRRLAATREQRAAATGLSPGRTS
jgi:hypothetical protein